MKTEIKFVFDDEKDDIAQINYEVQIINNRAKAFIALDEILNLLRTKTKHCDDELKTEVLENIREEIISVLDDLGILHLMK